MSELRWDPLKRHWVIIAAERGRRPQDFIIEHEDEKITSCPFCYGNEDKTPPAILSFSRDGSTNGALPWQVRVIPNKYPALRIEGELKGRGYGPYDVMDGIGAHEVIIETPEHKKEMADLSVNDTALVLKAYRDRLLDLRNDLRFRHMMIFKNHGKSAGATLPHSHSQLIAVPLTPPVAATELKVSRDYFQEKERCIFCDILDFELNEHKRIVKEYDRFVVLTPYASSLPFELSLMPKKHSHDFAAQSDSDLLSLAAAMKDMLSRVKKLLRAPSYNFIIHTSPPVRHRPGKPDYWGSLEYDYHWHIELVPRLTRIAGFEWGTGFHINPASPEECATFLKGVEL